MSKVRNYHFDNIKALLIFLVVFGHMIEPLRDIAFFKAIYFIIYSFHMPLFIFISGYFAKANTKGIKNLLQVFVKYEIIYALVYGILFWGSATITSEFKSILDILSYVSQPIWVLWFILSLVSWKLLLIIYEKYPKTSVFILVACIGFNFIPFNFRILSLGRTLSFFPYFLTGYLASKHQFNFDKLLLRKTAFVYLSIFIVGFWVMYSTTLTDNVLYGTDSFINQDISIFSLALIKTNVYLIATALSILVYNLVPERRLQISSIGTKTMPIFLLHPLVIWILMRISFFTEIRKFNSVFSLIILLVLSAAITLFLKDRKY